MPPTKDGDPLGDRVEEMFTQQTRVSEAESWSDLDRLGYDRDLKRRQEMSPEMAALASPKYWGAGPCNSRVRLFGFWEGATLCLFLRGGGPRFGKQGGRDMSSILMSVFSQAMVQAINSLPKLGLRPNKLWSGPRQEGSVKGGWG